MTPQEVERLYRKDRMAVRSILAEYESNWDVVDDLMQDVFMRALESEYDGRSQPLTWLCTIARNVGVDHVRAMHADKRRNEVLGGDLEGEEREEYYDRVDASGWLEESTLGLNPELQVEAADTFSYAMEAMGDQRSRVLYLRHLGHTNTEIAAEMGVSEKTVRNLLSEAKNFLRDNS